MLRLIAQRLFAVAPLLLVVTLITVVLSEMVPGDAASYVAGETASQDQVDQVREDLSLDDPLPQRYLEFVTDAITGDLGESFVTKEPVTDRIKSTIGVSFSLIAYAVSIALVVGLPLGAVAARFHRRWPDRVANTIATALMAVPPFVAGIILISVAAVGHRLFPATGYVTPFEDLGGFFRYATLPALALALTPAAALARQSRSALVDSQQRDYTRTAHAKGVGPWRVLVKHNGKNAAIPVVTTLGLDLTRMLGGTVVIEQIFAIPGFGSLAISAITQNDVPLIQGIVLVSALVVVFVNLLVDLSYLYFNPRMREA